MRLGTASAIAAVVALALLARAVSGLGREGAPGDPLGIAATTLALAIAGYILWRPDLRSRRVGDVRGRRTLRIVVVGFLVLLLGAVVFGAIASSRVTGG